MAQRYTCRICRNEVPHLGAECPYCRGRASIAEGASPRILVTVFAVMAVIFVLTWYYARSFKAEGEERGRLYFEAAQSEMATEHYDEAISRYRDALLYSRDNPTYRLELSRALIASGRYTETERHLSGLRSVDPTSGIVNLLLARLSAREDRIDEAVSYYRTAFHGRWDDAIEDARIDMRLELVDLLESSGRDQQLTAELLDLAEIAPSNAAIRTRLAVLLLRQGLYDRASSLFRSLLVSDPRNRQLLLGRADAEFELGNYLTARTHYNRAQLARQDDATAERAELCTRIIALDPTRRGITLDERFRRSLVLIDRAMNGLSSCRNPLGHSFVGPLPVLPPEQIDTVSAAESVLEATRRRASAAAVESNIQLAEQIWSIAATSCEPTDVPDVPFWRVMAKLSR